MGAYLFSFLKMFLTFWTFGMLLWNMGGILRRLMAISPTGAKLISAGRLNNPHVFRGRSFSSSEPLWLTNSVKASVWRAPVLLV